MIIRCVEHLYKCKSYCDNCYKMVNATKISQRILCKTFLYRGFVLFLRHSTHGSGLRPSLFVIHLAESSLLQLWLFSHLIMTKPRGASSNILQQYIVWKEWRLPKVQYRFVEWTRWQFTTVDCVHRFQLDFLSIDVLIGLLVHRAIRTEVHRAITTIIISVIIISSIITVLLSNLYFTQTRTPPSGNSGHVVVPKAWIGKEAIVILKESRTRGKKVVSGRS